MKHTFLLLALVGTLTLPVVSHADQPVKAKHTKDKSKQVTTAAQPAPAQLQAPAYVITKETNTGSHIPIVAYRDGNRLLSASSEQVYGINALNRAGQLDVGSELSFVEPSIVYTRGH